MSNRAEKQLKELRRLMPWCWDSRVDEHPPGEKGLHDFENVVNFTFDTRRRAAPAPKPETATKPPKQPKASQAKGTQRLTPEATSAGKLPVDNDSSKTFKRESSTDREPPPSTARHPTTAKPLGTTATPAVGSKANAKAKTSPPSAGAASRPTPVAPKSVQQSTPATAVVATPMTAPSTSRPTDPISVAGPHAAALADGQFLPTPGPTPATVVGANVQGGNAASVPRVPAQGDHVARGGPKPAASGVTFRSPAPRTVFNKKRQQPQQGVDVSIQGVQHVPTNPPPPVSTVKKARTTSVRPSPNVAAALPFTGDDNHGTGWGASATPVKLSFKNSLSKELIIPRPKGPLPPARPPMCPPLFKKMASRATQAPGGTGSETLAYKENAAMDTHRPESVAARPAFFTKERGLLQALGAGVLTASNPPAVQQQQQGPDSQLKMGSALLAAFQHMNRQRT